MKITIINLNESTHNNKKKRVAAYARVSSLSYEQDESFESQVEYYTRLIKDNPNYILVDIYADKGISGTQMQTRPNFMRMINDAMNGNIDIIYCKSISRFCRNAVQCQEIVQKLKHKMVEVIFEKENLSSFNPMSEMVFNFMTVIAQEESRSISENIIWALDKLAEKGIRRIGNRIFGYSEIDGVLTPNEYSPAVKMVFEQYANGSSISSIIQSISKMGCVGMKNKKPLSSSTISSMITNVIYKGDRIIQTRPHADYLSKLPDYTKDFNQYYVEDAHEAIVSKELWEECQKVRMHRIANHVQHS